MGSGGAEFTGIPDRPALLDLLPVARWRWTII